MQPALAAAAVAAAAAAAGHHIPVDLGLLEAELAGHWAMPPEGEGEEAGGRTPGSRASTSSDGDGGADPHHHPHAWGGVPGADQYYHHHHAHAWGGVPGGLTAASSMGVPGSSGGGDAQRQGRRDSRSLYLQRGSMLALPEAVGGEGTTWVTVAQDLGTWAYHKGEVLLQQAAAAAPPVTATASVATAAGAAAAAAAAAWWWLGPGARRRGATRRRQW
jgi:hypothetical protein